MTSTVMVKHGHIRRWHTDGSMTGQALYDDTTVTYDDVRYTYDGAPV